MPKWWCLALDFYGGDIYCGDWTCTGEFCGEFTANCGKLSGNMVCGDETIDILITIQKDIYGKCEVCLNSTCLGITDETYGACQSISSGEDLDGLTWDLDDLSGCSQYCDNTAVLTITKSQKCTPDNCIGCDCHTQQMCVKLLKEVYGDDDDCGGTIIGEFNCDTQELDVVVDCYPDDVDLNFRIGPEDYADYASDCTIFLTSIDLGVTDLETTLVCSNGDLSAEWVITNPYGNIVVSLSNLDCGCPCFLNIDCGILELPEILYAHFDDTGVNGACGDGFVVPIYVQKDPNGLPIENPFWLSTGHYEELPALNFGDCVGENGGLPTTVFVEFHCPTNFDPCDAQFQVGWTNLDNSDGQAANNQCQDDSTPNSTDSCFLDPFEFVYSSDTIFNTCLCCPDPGFDGQFTVTIRTTP